MHLNNHNLSTKGNKPQLVARLATFIKTRKARGPHKTSTKATRTPATPNPVLEEATNEPSGRGTDEGSGTESVHTHSRDVHSSEEVSVSPDLTTETKRSASRKKEAARRSRPEHHHPQKRQRRDSSSDHHRHRRQHRSRATSSSSSDSLATSPEHHHRHKHRRRAPSYSDHRRGRRHRSRATSSSSCDDSTTSPSPSPSSSSDSSWGRSRSSRRRHPRRRHHHRRSHRHRHDFWYHPSLQSSVACAPPLPRHIQDRIHRGKYVSFNKLLLPKGTIPISHATRETRKSKHKHHRQIEDLPTWLEAWNRYVCARVVSSPSVALELAKYQTLIVMFFTHHPAEQCINYDDLFRQAAARDPTLRWDAIKEDIYVWAFSKQTPKPPNSFRDKLPIASRLGPPVNTVPKPPADRATHTAAGKEICKRFNSAKCTRDDDCIFAHVCWHQHCQGPHPGRGCTKKTLSSGELSLNDTLKLRASQATHLYNTLNSRRN